MTRPVATSSAANERGRAVPLVVVRAPLDLARAHRQQRLGAVERLDLAFLVDAQDQRPIRRGHVQPDHVAHLRDEVGVGRELEGLDPVRLQAERPPDPLHRGGGQATRLGHAARAPMRAVGRQALESPADHRLDPLVADLARRARAPARRAARPTDARQIGGATCGPCRGAQRAARRPAAGCPSRRRPARSTTRAPALVPSAAAPPGLPMRPAPPRPTPVPSAAGCPSCAPHSAGEECTTRTSKSETLG